MEKLQFDNKQFCLYSPDSLKYITDNMQLLLEEKIEFYKELFNIKEFRKIQINYFDDLEEFRNYIKSLRNNDNSLPEYAVGTFDEGMINAYIPTDIKYGTPRYNKKRTMPTHELFHIMYMELILKKYDLERITWFDEGMAQLFSGDNDDILDQEKFDLWLDKLIENTKEIPNLNNLTHGTSFENNKYSGYDLSFLSVKYLYNFLGMENFKLLMSKTDEIKKYGENVIKDAINYYKKSKVIGYDR